MLKESKKGRTRFFYIIFCSICFALANAYRGHALGVGVAVFANLLLLLLIGIILAFAVYFLTCFKERKESFASAVVCNMICAISIFVVAYIYSKFVYVPGEQRDFMSAGTYWQMVIIVLAFVMLITCITELYKRKK